MPKYKIIILEDYDSPQDSPQGTEAEWDLPYEHLVFDQRIDYDSNRWVIRELRGETIVVAPNPGTRQGGDPKKHRIG